MKKTFTIMIAAGCLGLGSQAAIAGPDAAKIFKQKCTMCHAFDRKKVGPAVKDMNKDPAVLKAAITDGRKMMPAFGKKKKLNEAEIDALVKYIQSNQS
jgi:mono/diheme cytochrome c family protein